VALRLKVERCRSDPLAESDRRSCLSSKGAETPSDQKGTSDRPSIIIVEVLGYGGTQDDDQARRPGPDRNDRRSYDPTSPFQIVGSGAPNASARRYLRGQESST
jgi:hypothetical protein